MATHAGPSFVALVTVAWLVGILSACVPVSYRVTSHAATAIHEAGHFLAALLSGRSVRAIRLNTDSSGETVSIGRSRGPGVVVTLMAGYPAPSLVGLSGVLACRSGYLDLWLIGVLCLLGGTLLLLRNVFGVVVTLACLGVLELIRRTADPAQAKATALACSAFLLVAGVRGCIDLVRAGGRRHDAAGLAAVTVIPAAAWKAIFFLFSLACLVLAARWSVSDVWGEAGASVPGVQ